MGKTFYGRFPDGEITHSAKKYVAAWHAVADPLCRLYGLRLVGFDPHFLFDHPESGQTVDLPTSIALRMAAVAREVERLETRIHEGVRSGIVSPEGVREATRAMR